MRIKSTLLLILPLIISSCASISRSEQPAHPEFLEVDRNNQLGQTFLSQFDGLDGISLYLKPGQDTSGELSLRLYEGRPSGELLATVRVPGTEIQKAGFYNFTFPAIKFSKGQDYYFELAFNGPGSIKIGSAPGNNYLNGSQYSGDLALNSQSSFKLNYDAVLLITGLSVEGVYWILLLLIGMILFGIPGWAVLSWFFPPWEKQNWVTRICLSIGLGIAFYPILFLWMDTAGIHSNLLNALLLPILGCLAIATRYFLGRQGRFSPIEDQSNWSGDLETNTVSSSKLSSWYERIPDLAFLLIFFLLLFTRFWPIRGLDAPMWGDSYQHTMITQLLADNGGLFSSWEPYAQLLSFTYHFGFHALVSNFHWLTGLDVMQSILWVGQILNICAIIALYPVAILIGKNKWAGVIAVLIAGFLSSMPMAYVNWGRYTQLAGQVILPVIIYIAWKNLDSEQNDLWWDILVGFGLAGLALTHYRVTIFIPLFYASYLLLNLKRLRTFSVIRRMLIQGAGMVVLILPWLLRLFEGTLPEIFGAQISSAASNVSQALEELNAIGNISNYLPLLIWLLLFLAVGWGIVTRNHKSNIFSLWWFLILLAANPNWLRLPGTGILTNFAIFIAAYIPAAVLIGAGLSSFLIQVNLISSEEIRRPEPFRQRKFIWSTLLLISLVFLGAWFTRPRIRDVKPGEFALLTRPDLRAVEWIKENLPGEANFLVNSFFAYGGTLVVGSDGGWWLPLLTEHDSSQPPLTYGSETGIRPDYVEFINSLVTLIEENGLDDPGVLSELDQRGIRYIFIGQQQGQVNANSVPLLDVNFLINDPNFSEVYHEDRVWIFKLINTQGQS
jgi:hypothetical protein